MLPSFFKKLGPINVREIKSKISCETKNLENENYFHELVSLNNIKENSLSFLYDYENFKSTLPLTSCLICTQKKLRELNPNQSVMIVRNVQEAVAKISNIFYRDLLASEINNLSDPIIGNECEIGKNVTIENGAIIGDKVKINHGVVIKHNCVIGEGSIIGSNAVLTNSILGEDVYIGSNSTIGQRGFGFYLNNNDNINIYHKGRVIIKSKVSIGSSCTIDRGSFSDTIIGENTYIDNLCHIAHNVEIGNNSTFAAMTGIAGSAKIGSNVLTGGQAGIAGHVKIGDNVQIAAKSGVFNSLKNGASVMGNPAINKYNYIRTYKKLYGKR